VTAHLGLFTLPHKPQYPLSVLWAYSHTPRIDKPQGVKWQRHCADKGGLFANKRPRWWRNHTTHDRVNMAPPVWCGHRLFVRLRAHLAGIGGMASKLTPDRARRLVSPRYEVSFICVLIGCFAYALASMQGIHPNVSSTLPGCDPRPVARGVVAFWRSRIIGELGYSAGKLPKARMGAPK